MITPQGIIIGLTMMVLGVLSVKYAFWLHNITGAQEWLENFTGPGTTMGMYKIIGTLLILIGVLWATGFGLNVMNFLFSPIAALFKH